MANKGLIEPSIAIIGGTGLYAIGDCISKKKVSTPYGDVELQYVSMDAKTCVELNNTNRTQTAVETHTVVFIARHGAEHSTPPHKINYRANIFALHFVGIKKILATNAVGGIDRALAPGKMVVPDQVIDYTWGREHTFYDAFTSQLCHADFTEPFSKNLRTALIASAVEEQGACISQGVYGCVQGPRLETAAEVQRFKQDGCTMLGMTGMPEAALARELGLEYATLCYCVNWAAGIGGPISVNAVYTQIQQSADALNAILRRCIHRLV